MILGKFRISGHSMEPTLKNAQTVIVSSLPYLFTKPKVSDIIAFRFNNKTLIKRISLIRGSKILVSGDNIGDSLKTTPIKEKDILGKVIV